MFLTASLRASSLSVSGSSTPDSIEFDLIRAEAHHLVEDGAKLLDVVPLPFIFWQAAPFFCSGGESGTAMTDKAHEILLSRLAEIDQRRAEVEFMLSTMPPNAPCCDGDGDNAREELEVELRDLWAIRTDIFEQLKLRLSSAVA